MRAQPTKASFPALKKHPPSRSFDRPAVVAIWTSSKICQTHVTQPAVGKGPRGCGWMKKRNSFCFTPPATARHLMWLAVVTRTILTPTSLHTEPLQIRNGCGLAESWAVGLESEPRWNIYARHLHQSIYREPGSVMGFY